MAKEVAAARQATPLIPAWTEDDFYSDAVYEWLWARRGENPYKFQMFLGMTQKKARELRINGFMRTWNEYVRLNTQNQPTVMGANMTNFPDQPMQMESREYVCTDDGVSYTGRDGGKVDVISHPLLPVRRIVNIDTLEEKIQIAYWRSASEGWKTLITGSEVISSAQKIIALSKNGISVNSENAKEVVKYLSYLRDWNYQTMAIQKSASHLGWLPDGGFAPYAEGIEYDGESPEHNRMYAAFTPQGSFEEWMKIAKEARSGVSVPARVALAGAFAAPLVSLCNALPFIIHFYGTSGMGKSVGLMLSASVWAEPTVGGAYIKTFGGTKVAQELTAAFLCNVPMYLDELQIISDRKSFDDMIYMLCEGASKGRGARDGGLQLQKRWSNCILTTGEMPIVQNNSGGGAAVRTIEVGYGGLPFFPDSRDVANRLKSNYGFAGRKFIEALADPDVMKRMKDVQKEFQKDLSGDIHGKQVLSASILLAADTIADEVLFHDGKALTIDDIKPYLVTNQQADANYRCYQWLMGFIASNPRRFDLEDNNGELWGVFAKNKAGKEVLYFIRSAFDKIMAEEGFSTTTFLTWAKLNGKIDFENYGTGSGNNRLTQRYSINGHRVTCVALYPSTDDEDEKPKPGEYMEVKDDDLPF